jgi:cbb3-type cytochrome oxidase maturation protein
VSVLYLVLPLALLIATCSVLAFVWAVRSGQLDDFDTPALRVLLDDQVAAPVCAKPASSCAVDADPA